MALLMQAAERVAEARDALRGMGKETASIVEKGTKNIAEKKRKLSCSVAQVGAAAVSSSTDDVPPEAMGSSPSGKDAPSAIDPSGRRCMVGV